MCEQQRAHLVFFVGNALKWQWSLSGLRNVLFILLSQSAWSHSFRVTQRDERETLSNDFPFLFAHFCASYCGSKHSSCFPTLLKTTVPLFLMDSCYFIKHMLWCFKECRFSWKLSCMCVWQPVRSSFSDCQGWAPLGPTNTPCAKPNCSLKCLYYQSVWWRLKCLSPLSSSSDSSSSHRTERPWARPSLWEGQLK